MTFYLQCINIDNRSEVRRFQPLGFAYAVSFVPARDIDGSRFLNLKCNNLKNSEVVTFSCAVNGRVQVDDVWADAPRISLGEDLYVSKIDFQPYTTNNFNSDKDEAWKVGISRVNKFKGMKRGASLNRTLDIFIVIHNHPNRLQVSTIKYSTGDSRTDLKADATGLLDKLKNIEDEGKRKGLYSATEILDIRGGAADRSGRKPEENKLGPDDGSKTFKIRKEIQDARMGGHNDMAGIGDMLKKGAKSLKKSYKKAKKGAKKAGEALKDASGKITDGALKVGETVLDSAALGIMSNNNNIGTTNKRRRKTSRKYNIQGVNKLKRRKVNRGSDNDDY